MPATGKGFTMANIDKPLTPMGEIEADEADVELEIIEEPTVEEDEDGGVVIDFAGGEDKGEPDDSSLHSDDISRHMDENDLNLIASRIIQDFEMDLLSRKDWEKTYIKGLDLLGMSTERRTKPWAGASGVFHPMLTEAVIRFQAEAISELFPAGGPVKTKILGKSSRELIAQAHRVENEMNYLVTEEMAEFREETEQMLYKLAIAGSAFKKTYYDPELDRAVSMFVGVEDFVISYGATDLRSCNRYTHVMKTEKNDVKKMQLSGFYRQIDLPDPAPDFSDVKEKQDKLTGETPSIMDDDRHMILEVHVDYDLPEPFNDPDGIERPYIISVDKSSSTVLSIRRNWKEGDEKQKKRMHFTHYKYLPGLGFYGTGLVHLLGGLTGSATSILRQLIDAGTLANLPGGLKARGLRVKGDSTPIAPGEFRDVDVPGGAIKDSITYLPYKEPSGVLYQLLGNVVEEGRRIGSVADLDIGSTNANAPVGTTLALMERSLKVMSGVQARLHAAMKKEFKIISDIVHEHMPKQYSFNVEGDFSRIEDFDGRVDVIPVSDPNAATMAQRVMQYQAAIQLSAQAPQAYDVGLLHRGMLETLNIQNAEDIVKLPDEIKPADPVTENMAIMKQEAVLAFQYQDHEAHIAVHMAALQDPKIQQIVGQSPFAEVIQSAMASHITEHVAMQYRVEMEKNLGVPMPESGTNLPEDAEVELSRLTAQAAGKLLGKNQAEAAAEEAARQEADPLTQLQQREMGVKERKLDHEIKMDQQELALKTLEALSDEQLARERIKSEERKTGAQIGARLATEIDKGLQSTKLEGARLGIDVAKDLAEKDKKESSDE